jgi:transposase InsO family protein
MKKTNVGSAYIKPGSPWENGHVESFHASLRAEFLDRELFFSLKEVAVMLEDWRDHYNHERPHGSLSNRPPVHGDQVREAVKIVFTP